MRPICKFLFWFLLLSVTCVGRQTNHLSRHAVRIKRSVSVAGIGANLTVTMRDRSTHSGTLLDIEQTQFSLNEPNVAQPVRIAYEDVEKVKAAKSANAARARRGLNPVAVGAVVCAVILLIVFR